MKKEKEEKKTRPKRDGGKARRGKSARGREDESDCSVMVG
jgi:hypothetical protein